MSVFTPDSEPYLGRKMLYEFDKMIVCLMEHNEEAANTSHRIRMSSAQLMAAQQISQSISLLLSIRELIRQGYLFGGHVLKRSMVERVVVLLYLHEFPEQVSKWEAGWKHRDAPSLHQMIKKIAERMDDQPTFERDILTKSMNDLVHGKPESAYFSMSWNEEEGAAFQASKMLNSDSLCDDLCADCLPWCVVILSMMSAYFPAVSR